MMTPKQIELLALTLHAELLRAQPADREAALITIIGQSLYALAQETGDDLSAAELAYFFGDTFATGVAPS